VRAVVVTRFGGPEVLALREEPEPRAGPGQLLVDTESIGVNFRDVYERAGAYGGEPPFVAGVEGAGRVVATGERIAWVAAPGSYAERVVVDAEKAIPVPDGVPSELAAAALLQGITAQYLATSTYPIEDGDTVVVHAAAGGVGQLLVQLAKARGARVIATTSGGDKEAAARSAGADDAIGYDGFADRVRELTGGEGAAVVYDGIGRATFEESLAALRRRGTLVLYGSASGDPAPYEPARLRQGSLYLTRPQLHDYTATREELLERAGDVLRRLADGSLQVSVGGQYELAEAARAHEDLEARRTTGKLLLQP
jgi:NADPH2:quinone reductase